MDIVTTCAAAAATAANSSSNPQLLQSYLNTMAGLDNIPRKEKQFLNFMANSLNLKGGKHGVDICKQLWNILKQEKDRRIMAEKERTQDSLKEKETSEEETSSSSAEQPQPEKDSNTPPPPSKEPTNSAADTSPSNNTKDIDKKKVHKAMKKALKKAPNRSMKVKDLRKLLWQEYGIQAKKTQLQQVMASYKKAKIDGKTISLVSTD